MRLSIILLSICAFAVSAAHAKCKPGMQSEQFRVDNASAIFVAKIISAELAPAPYGGQNVTARYRLLKTLKGEPAKTGSVTSFLGVPGIELTPGVTYLFFEYGSKDVGFCGGSQRLDFYNAPFKNRDRELLKHLEKLIGESPNIALNLTALPASAGKVPSALRAPAAG